MGGRGRRTRLSKCYTNRQLQERALHANVGNYRSSCRRRPASRQGPSDLPRFRLLQHRIQSRWIPYRLLDKKRSMGNFCAPWQLALCQVCLKCSRGDKQHWVKRREQHRVMKSFPVYNCVGNKCYVSNLKQEHIYCIVMTSLIWS